MYELTKISATHIQLKLEYDNLYEEYKKFILEFQKEIKYYTVIKKPNKPFRLFENFYYEVKILEKIVSIEYDKEMNLLVMKISKKPDDSYPKVDFFSSFENLSKNYLDIINTEIPHLKKHIKRKKFFEILKNTFQ